MDSSPANVSNFIHDDNCSKFRKTQVDGASQKKKYLKRDAIAQGIA